MSTKKKFLGAVAGVGLLAAGAVMAGQGYYGQGGSLGQPTWPSPNTTNNTLPLTGLESWVVDTQLPNGQNPQSEYVSLQQVANYFGAGTSHGFRNVLLGGDFTTNLFQRGANTTGITNTVTYGPDRWFAIGGASSAISLLKLTSAADISANFGASLKFSQVSTTDVAVVNLGQVVSTLNSYRFAGRNAVFSGWVRAGAGAPASFTATINSGTAADGTAANMVAAGWTGEVSNSCVITGAPTANSTFSRFSCSFPIPVNALQVGTQISFTPTGSSSTTDWFEFEGLQLEETGLATAWAASGNYSANETVVSNGNLYKETAVTCTAGSVAPNGSGVFTDNTCSWSFQGTGFAPVQPSSFEFRSADVERELQYQYYYQITEAATQSIAMGMCTATNVEGASLPIPSPFRVKPTLTVTAGTFKWNINGTQTAVTTLTLNAGSTNTVIGIGDTTACTAGQTTLLNGSATTGIIRLSAEY